VLVLIYESIIIGAGPAGLFAGNILKKDFIILEKNDVPGKKLLITGNGMCNITNALPKETFYKKYGDKKNYIKKILNIYSNDDLIKYFESEGIVLIKDKNNKIFPKSKKASDILEVLTRNISDKIIYSSPVKRIMKENDVYLVMTENKIYKAKNIILSTGGKSFPHTGSTGDGYMLASDHNIVIPKPALDSLKMKNFDLKNYSGISFPSASLSLLRNNKKIFSDTGSLLITHTGFSGPLILHSSRYFENGDILEICFVRTDNTEKTYENFYNFYNRNNKKLKDFYNEFSLPSRLFEFFCSENSVNPNSFFTNIPKKTYASFLSSFIKRPYKITDYGNWNTAMVTSGGINLKDINVNTMESKNKEGFYFAGEVIDIDGNTGGYNLQFAFSSAYIAASAINKKSGF